MSRRQEDLHSRWRDAIAESIRIIAERLNLHVEMMDHHHRAIMQLIEGRRTGVIISDAVLEELRRMAESAKSQAKKTADLEARLESISKMQAREYDE